MKQEGHIVKSYDEEIKDIKNSIVDMGSLVEKQLKDSLQCLKNKDTEFAEKIIENDNVIDKAYNDLDQSLIEILGKRQPMASDLRTIFSAIKINKDLERIGDLSKSNAKKVKPLPLDLPDELLGNLKRLGELVMKQLNDVLDSYVNKNFDKAKEVWEKDEQVDDLTYIAMESVIDFLSKDKKNLDFSTHLIFATKNLERAGDHITNIAETVCYLVKGEYLKGSRPKGKVIQE